MEFWKKFFKYAAFWNWFFTALGIFAPNVTRMIMKLPQIQETDIFQGLFFGAVGVFGLMYWLVHNDPASETSKKLVQLGIIGKILVFFYFAHFFFTSRIGFFGFLPAFGDLVFSIFFIVFLVFPPQEAK